MALISYSNNKPSRGHNPRKNRPRDRLFLKQKPNPTPIEEQDQNEFPLVDIVGIKRLSHGNLLVRFACDEPDDIPFIVRPSDEDYQEFLKLVR